MEYSLPKKVNICGEIVPIRYDFRVMMDIFEVIAMDDLTEQEKIYVALSYFYPQFPKLPDAPSYEESMSAMFRFMDGCGAERSKKSQNPPAKLVSWADDYPYICAAVNRILGYDCRGVEYDQEKNSGGVHWWTFLGAYMEIGDCFFSHIVSIRSQKAKGKTLDKADEQFYKENREIIDATTRLSAADEAWMESIL